MKNLKLTIVLFVYALFLYSSCNTTSTLTNRHKEVKTFAIDFRKYTDRNFLFMPEQYYGEYEVKGILTAELHPEVIYVLGKNKGIENKLAFTFYNGDKLMTQLVTIPNHEDLIEHIYQTTIEWGGDAFTNFKSSIETAKTDENPNTVYTYYQISGIVIKRK